MRHCNENWKSGFSNAFGICLSKQNTYSRPTKTQRGVAVNLRGLLLRSYSITASSSLFWGGWPVQNVHDATQPLLWRAKVAIWQSVAYGSGPSLATC